MSEILIHLDIKQLPEGAYLATSDDVPGLVAQGRTVTETIEIARDVTRKIIESYREHGDPLPPALAQSFTGRVEVVTAVGID